MRVVYSSFPVTVCGPLQALLTRDLHVVPFYQGSRSVIADPELRGYVREREREK